MDADADGKVAGRVRGIWWCNRQGEAKIGEGIAGKGRGRRAGPGGDDCDMGTMMIPR